MPPTTTYDNDDNSPTVPLNINSVAVVAGGGGVAAARRRSHSLSHES